MMSTVAFARRSHRHRFIPCLELLEDRTAPAIFHVAPGDTSGLIAAIQDANALAEASTIHLATGSHYSFTAPNNSLLGGNALPIIANDISIEGHGATVERDVDASTPAFRLFFVSAGPSHGGLPQGTLRLFNLTVSGGLAAGDNSDHGGGGLGAGGAIFNGGVLTLDGVTLTGNTAAGGDSGVAGATGSASGGFGEGGHSGGGAGGFGGGNGATGAGGAGGGGAGLGGAIFNFLGTVSLTNSTLAGNTALGGSTNLAVPIGGGGGSAYGGAIFNLAGTVNLLNSTVARNEATVGQGAVAGAADGGSIYSLAATDSPFGPQPVGTATVQLTNSLLANSTGSLHELVNDHRAGQAVLDGTGNPNLVTSWTNLTGATQTGTDQFLPGAVPFTGPDARLALNLTNNGGFTPTLALLHDSPALHVANAAVAPTTDQRGFTRQAQPDLGAFEVLPPSWNGYESLGTSFYSQLASGRDGWGQLLVFGIGQDQAVWVNEETQPGGHFAGWQSLGGSARQIVVEVNQDGRLMLFALFRDGTAWFRKQTHGLNFTPWSRLSGRFSQLAVAKDGQHQLQLFGISRDGSVWVCGQTAPNAVTFGPWTNLGGRVRQIAVATRGDGLVQLFAIARNATVVTRLQDGGGFRPWQSLGGAVAEIAVGREGSGRLQLFGLDRHHRVWLQDLSDNQGNAWKSLGGNARQLEVGTDLYGALYVFTIGADRAVWYRKQNSPTNRTYADWKSLGGQTRQLSVANEWNGELALFATSTLNVPYVNRQGVPVDEQQRREMALGAGYNGLFLVDQLLPSTYLTDLAKTGATWIRGFIDYFDWAAGPRTTDFAQLRAAKDAGYQTIINLKFDFWTDIPLVLFPTTPAEIEATLADLDELLQTLYGLCDILVIGNEPLLETPPEVRGEPAFLNFYQAAAERVKAFRDTQLVQVPLYLGAYDNLWITTGQWQEWAKPLLDYTRETPWLAGADLHIHQDAAGDAEIGTVFNFVEPLLREDQLILVSEFSQVNYYQKYTSTATIPPVLTKPPYNRQSMPVWQFLNEALHHPVSLAEWTAFLQNSNWYASQTSYLDVAWAKFNSFSKFHIATYGVYQTGPTEFLKGSKPWILNPLFVNQTVVAGPDGPQFNPWVADQFKAIVAALNG